MISESATSRYKKLLPGVPLVESPFFSAIFNEQTTDKSLLQIARSLNKHGYAILDFNEPEFDSIAKSIKENLTSSFDWEGWRQSGYQYGEGLRLQDAWKFNEDVRRIATNQPILDILAALFGRKAFPFQTLNFPVGSQQHFHTDAVHFSSVPERFMCGVWVALEDIHEEAGPLIYYPGSHKWPIYANEHIELDLSQISGRGTQGNYEPLWRELVLFSGIEAKTFTPKKGQALIWLSNLLHGGAKQFDPQLTRWSQVTHYYFENCAYFTPMNSEVFLSRIDYRSVWNISSDAYAPNMIHGTPIAEDFIAAVGRKRIPLPADFDVSTYLAKNPDVAAAGVDPAEHYLLHGWSEGRRYR